MCQKDDESVSCGIPKGWQFGGYFENLAEERRREEKQSRFSFKIFECECGGWYTYSRWPKLSQSELFGQRSVQVGIHEKCSCPDCGRTREVSAMKIQEAVGTYIKSNLS